VASSDKMSLLSEIRSELGSLTTFIEKLYLQLEGRREVDHATQALIQSDAIDRIIRMHEKVQASLKDHDLSKADPGFMGTTIDGHLHIITQRLENLKKGNCLQDRTWPNALLSALRDYEISLEILMRNL